MDKVRKPSNSVYYNNIWCTAQITKSLTTGYRSPVAGIPALYLKVPCSKSERDYPDWDFP
jgi:hypothetical protein